MRKTAWIALILCIAVLAGCTASVGTVEDTGSGTDSVKIKGNPFDTLSLLDIGKIQNKQIRNMMLKSILKIII